MESKSSDSAYKRPSVYSDTQHAQVTSILADGDVPYADHEMDADERVIMALGYKQEFKREFSLWTTFCVSFAVLGLLPSFASTLYYGVFLVSAWPCSQSSLTYLNRYGICRNSRYGLGLDHRYDLYPMYCDVYGGAVLGHAYEVCHCHSPQITLDVD